MIKFLLRILLRLLYRVEISGLENVHKAGDRVLMVANHVSFLDPPLLWAFLPGSVTFAINTQIARKKWIKPFLRFSDVFEMDPTNPLSLKQLVHHLLHNNRAIIFPEGRITVTGSMMKIYDGTGMVADKAKARILPIRIDGAQYTYFSRIRHLTKMRLFPKIRIHILPPCQLDIPGHIRGKGRRHYSGRRLSDLMTNMMFVTSPYQQSIFSAILQARKTHGGRHVVAEDLERVELNYNALITRCIALAKQLNTISCPNETVGVMLPNSNNTLIVILALQLYGRIPAMLNFSTGLSGMSSACNTARIKTVLTSRRFIETAKLQDEADGLNQQLTLIYLEDLALKISPADKLHALIQSKTVDYGYPKMTADANNPAVVLFTSGSEGTPKGVVLSHANILANHKQLQTRISFTPHDRVLNVLPMFHSFGFTAGTLFPVLHGLKTFLYPTPLHFGIIPEIAYEQKSTVLFSTNSFLAAYGKKAHPYDFFNIRYVFAGAEKLHHNTRELWSEKFGIRILEGYGATETSPILSANTPMEYRPGSVGRFFPGIQYRLEPVPGITDAGKLHVKGPNIMRGYLLAGQPGQLTPPHSLYGSGWYDTGDIVHIDEQGYIHIRGRSKRFAKISGEMVSLTAVEQLASQVWPDAQHAVVSLPDPRKGEQLILLTTQADASSQYLINQAKGVGAIGLPKKILIVDALPVLATGKIDYPAATELAIEKFL